MQTFSGIIENDQNMYLDIPLQFDGNDYQVSTVSLKGITIVGADGSIIKAIARKESSEIKTIPVSFFAFTAKTFQILLIRPQK